MQITYQPNPLSFKEVKISPRGQRAIDREEYQEICGPKAYIRDLQRRRANDKYVFGNIVGDLDEYGYSHIRINIKDKVTNQTFRSPFKVDSPKYRLCHEIRTEDGQRIPENVAVLKDAKGQTRYFTFANDIEASAFARSANGEGYYANWGMELLGPMENYYKNIFDTKKGPTDKFVELLSLLRQNYKGPFHKYVPEIIKKENLLGEGKDKAVYKIDKLPDYVLCVMRNKYNPDEPIGAFHQCFQTTSVTDTDFPIIMNDNGMYIKKYVAGKSHSLPNWSDKFHKIEPLTYEDIKYFKQSLKELSTFPAKSFVDFAKKLQELNEERIRIDTINPNNIIIDKDIQSINLIDFGSKENALPRGIMRPINGLSDMAAVLCDSLMYMRYYDMANDEDKAQLDEYAKTIIYKCNVAAKVSNIGNYPPNTELYTSNMDDRIPFKEGGTRLEMLKSFIEHFKESLSRKVVSTAFDSLWEETQRELLAKHNLIR